MVWLVYWCLLFKVYWSAKQLDPNWYLHLKFHLQSNQSMYLASNQRTHKKTLVKSILEPTIFWEFTIAPSHYLIYQFHLHEFGFTIEELAHWFYLYRQVDQADRFEGDQDGSKTMNLFTELILVLNLEYLSITRYFCFNQYVIAHWKLFPGAFQH